MRDPLLDEPLPVVTPKEPRWSSSILGKIELAAFMLWIYGLLGGLTQFPFAAEALLLAFWLLILLYGILPARLLGAEGWQQKVLSHVAGFIFIMALGSALLKLQSWEGADMLRIIAGIGSLLAILISVMYLIFKSPEEQLQSFCYMVLIRMAVVLWVCREALLSIF